jgi:O-antigen ligase
MHADGNAGALSAAVMTGALAAVVTIAALTNLKYLAALLIVWMVAVIFLLSGNKRLAILYSLLLLAPLRLGKAFVVIPHMGGASGFWIDAIDPLMFALLALQINDVVQGRRESFHFPRVAYFWVGLILLGVGSALMAPFRMMAAHEVVRMLKLLLLFLVVVNECVDNRKTSQASAVLLFGVFLNSVLAIAQWVRGKNFGLEFLGEADPLSVETIGSATLVTGEFVYRPGGLMGAGNLFAAYLALLLPVAIALLFSPVRARLKTMLLITILIGQASLVLTLSRSGWIAFIASFLCVLFFGLWNSISRRRFLAIRTAVVVVMVVLGLAFSPLVIQRLTGSDPGALNIRFEWLRVAQAMVYDKPLFGVGLNKYVFVQVPYGEDKSHDAMTARYGELWPVVHSTWAVTWAEQGTIGFILFVAMHIGILRIGIANLRIRDPVIHALGVGFMSGFIAIMVDGLSSFFLRVDQHARVFWIVTAMVVAIGYLRRATEQRQVEKKLASDEAGSEREQREPPGSWLPVPSSALDRRPAGFAGGFLPPGHP